MEGTTVTIDLDSKKRGFGEFATRDDEKKRLKFASITSESSIFCSSDSSSLSLPSLLTIPDVSEPSFVGHSSSANSVITHSFPNHFHSKMEENFYDLTKEEEEPLKAKTAVVQTSNYNNYNNNYTKTICSYGSRCQYQSELSHSRKFSHPKKQDKSEKNDEKQDDRPVCQYGSRCLYIDEYSHSKRFNHSSKSSIQSNPTSTSPKIAVKKETEKERKKREKEWADRYSTTETLRYNSHRTMTSIRESNLNSMEEINEGLADKQKLVISQVATGQNVFYTGPAGTGKSFLLKRIISLCKYLKKWVAVTASTGVAATNVGGMTIHSWSGIGLGDKTEDETYFMIKHRENLMKEWQRTDVLIIDEISMISAGVLDLLDKMGRRIRVPEDSDPDTRSPFPFGGIQIILVGDFYQLPPVFSWKKEKIAHEEALKKDPKAVMPTRAYFSFESAAWKSLNLKFIELTKVFRQEDQTFVTLLNSLRNGIITEESEKILSKCKRPLPVDDKILPTKLYPDNRDVDQENENELSKLPGEVKQYSAMDTIHCDKADWFKSSIVPSELNLKINAQVMLLSNVDTRYSLVNGSRGVVIGFISTEYLPEVEKEVKERRSSGIDLYLKSYPQLPVVKFGGTTCVIMPELFMVETGGSIRASRVQLPLKMAWALTVHKSQGMTLDKVELSMERAFAPGQAYVALSRCRSLEGIHLKSFPRSCVKADAIVLKWYQENPSQ